MLKASVFFDVPILTFNNAKKCVDRLLVTILLHMAGGNTWIFRTSSWSHTRLLEVVQNELKFLQHFFTKKYFDIGLNNRLRWYDFVVNKPTLIDPEVVKGNHKIRQCVSQVMTLVQELPLVVGDKIPEKITIGNVLLIAITKICLSPRISHTVAFLRSLIEEKLSTFCWLYPEAHLIPKFHYIHYPSQIECFGPHGQYDIKWSRAL